MSCSIGEMLVFPGEGEDPMTRRHVTLLAALALCGGVGLAGQQGAPNEGQAQAGPRLKIERDLEYSKVGGQSLKLDLYRQDPTAAPSPVVLWIHGTEGSLTQRSPTPAAALVTPGYAVATIDYRTGAGVTLASQVSD